jgi:hypothetical protein
LDSEAINLEALETLVRVAGMAVELLATRSTSARRATPQPTQTEETPSFHEATPASAPTREYEPPPVSVTEEAVYQPETVASEFDTVETPTETVEAQPEYAVAEPEQEHAEPMVQSAASPASAEAPSTPQGTRRRYGMDVELPVSVDNEEERRLHNDARRFARLLVSEIKLYNEQKVSEGRSQHDLYERLREYIDRSREMYDKRVKPEVAGKYDYFHHELVNTLAEGDPGKLGNAYPGATVSA